MAKYTLKDACIQLLADYDEGNFGLDLNDLSTFGKKQLVADLNDIRKAVSDK